MADFVAVIRKTIDGLAENSPETRERVYEKARATIAAKLAAISPPPPPVVVQRQKEAIEDAIRVVEAQYAAPDESADEEFDAFLANLDNPDLPAAQPPRTQVPAAVEAPSASPATASFSAAPLSGPAVAPVFDDAPAPAAETRFTQHESPDPELVPEGSAETRGHDIDPVLAHAASPQAEPSLEPVTPVRRPEPALVASIEPGARRSAPPRARSRRSFVGPIVALAALIVIGGASYGIWLNREEFASLLGMDDEAQPAQTASELESPEAAQEPQQNAAVAEPEAVSPSPPQPESTPAPTGNAAPEKFTQRLTPTGEEIDEGPANTPAGIGEGTSVAAVTPPAEGEAPASGQPAQTPAAPQQPANGEASGVPVGQRAIFYEERTASAMGTAEQGSVVWSLIQESPGNNLPPEPAIRAELAIPSKDLEMRLTIRRNADASLPASHIVEMIFLTPENFEGGSVANVLRLALKPSEEAPGNPLIGIPAKIADGYFLVALSDQQADIAVNMQLMQRQSWIDIPIIYSNGRRALVTLEKGLPGDRIFTEALQAWQADANGNAG